MCVYVIQVAQSAFMLYGLIHARFIVTTRGLDAMLKKYRLAEFGRCPRMLCRDQVCYMTCFAVLLLLSIALSVSLDIILCLTYIKKGSVCIYAYMYFVCTVHMCALNLLKLYMSCSVMYIAVEYSSMLVTKAYVTADASDTKSTALYYVLIALQCIV
jgi:Casein kinase II regulatory subunit